MKQQKYSAGAIVLAVLITALVVGVAMYLWQISKVAPQLTQTESKISPAKLIDSPTIGTAIEQSYNFSQGAPDTFTSIDRGNQLFLKKKASAEIYANEEQIESFFAPENPANKDVVFISTSIAPTQYSEGVKILNKIYSYNIKTGELTQIYEENEPRLLRTMGMDGSKLILMYDAIENSPGPCFSIWADWKNFGYLEIANISAGLNPYTVPDYQIATAKAEQKQCEMEMGF
ncbi:hypothetical protein KKC32_03100 [Patescibacteria group bacterium]|nr:hypothetical protein [Patescibacteria group bacterium]